MTLVNLPFLLTDRPAVRRIRQVYGPVPAERGQPMTGFEDRFTDIVDYIVRITDEIWQARAVGYIRDTYDPACAVYSSYGVTRTAEAVVRSTIAGIAADPDGDTIHLNIAWSGDDERGFYTAHLGFGFCDPFGRRQLRARDRASLCDAFCGGLHQPGQSYPHRMAGSR